jgi:hypothetical protein
MLAQQHREGIATTLKTALQVSTLDLDHTCAIDNIDVKVSNMLKLLTSKKELSLMLL